MKPARKHLLSFDPLGFPTCGEFYWRQAGEGSVEGAKSNMEACVRFGSDVGRRHSRENLCVGRRGSSWRTVTFSPLRPGTQALAWVRLALRRRLCEEEARTVPPPAAETVKYLLPQTFSFSLSVEKLHVLNVEKGRCLLIFTEESQKGPVVFQYCILSE